MKRSIMSRTLVVLLLCVIAASSHPNTRAQGRSTAGFPQRRLLNLSGNSVGQRRLLNLSGNSIGQRRLLNLRGNSIGQRRLLNLSGNSIGQRRLLNLSGNELGPHRRLLNLSGNELGPHRRLLNLSGNELGPHRRLLNPSGNELGPHRRLLNLSGNSIEPTEVPECLIVKPGNKLHKVLKGKGFQEYVYENGNWTLYNATATLRTFAGKKVGEHYFLPKKDALGGQPSWKSFAPESLCTGAPSVKVTVSKEAIPWLLLAATHSSGSSREFGEVTYVQRLYTEQGVAPGPSHSASPGEKFKSPYTAIYFFYKRA
ncbi:unnamed protein product [Calypogeia fissa]